MDPRSRFRLLSFAVVAVVGCSGAPSPSGSPSQAAPSARATAGPTAVGPTAVGPTAPAQVSATVPPIGLASDPFEILPADPPAGFAAPIICSGDIGPSDPVAIVQLKGAIEDEFGDFVLRNYADPGNVRTVCTFRPRPYAYEYSSRFIDGRHFVMEAYTDEARRLFVIVDVPGVRLRWFQLPATTGEGSQFITVAPGLDRIVWKGIRPSGEAIDEIHETTTAGDVLIATLPDRNEGRCGSAEDSNEGGYTASGSHLYVLNQPISPNNSLLVFEGSATKLSIRAPDADWPNGKWPAMTLWSPTSPTLYFRQDGDVWTWTPADGKRRFLSDVTWFHPTISPDGRYLAYYLKVGDTTETHLIDLEGDRVPVRIGSGSTPVFLGATQLWYLRDGPSGDCAGEWDPKEMIYDVSNGSEVASDIHQVVTVWPSASSNQ